MADEYVKLIPVDYAEVALGGRLDGDPEPMLLTFGVRIQDGATIDTTTLNTAMTAIATTLQSQTPQVFTWTQWKVRMGSAFPEIPTEVFEGSLNIDGTLAVTSLLPQNSAFLIRKTSAMGGRRGRGRFYFPAVPDNVVDNIGVVDPSKVTALNTSFTNMLAAVAASATFSDMVLLHTFKLPLPVAYPGPTPVVSMVAQSIIATQRRRLRR